MVLAVGFVYLVERLRNQEGAQPVAGHEGERGFKEVEPAECGELVEHQQQLVLALHAVAAIERFSEAPSDLVEDQTNERLGAADVRRRYHAIGRASCRERVCRYV